MPRGNYTIQRSYEECGKIFTPPTLMSKYCCPACSKRAVLAKMYFIIWKEISNTSNGNEKKSQRNLLVISYFSIFFHINEKQKSEACRGYSVTKSLAGLLPAGIR